MALALLTKPSRASPSLDACAASALTSTSADSTSADSTTSTTDSATLPAFHTSVNPTRFYPRGVDSRAASENPLAGYATCARGIPYLVRLGLNVLCVYTVDNSGS